MDAHIKKVYVPMTETAFYILLCLQEERHGYSIVQKVEELTDGAVKLSPGTMYGSLSKMEKVRIKRLYQNMISTEESVKTVGGNLSSIQEDLVTLGNADQK